MEYVVRCLIAPPGFSFMVCVSSEELPNGVAETSRSASRHFGECNGWIQIPLKKMRVGRDISGQLVRQAGVPRAVDLVVPVVQIRNKVRLGGNSDGRVGRKHGAHQRGT